jgi:hypothetical protein
MPTYTRAGRVAPKEPSSLLTSRWKITKCWTHKEQITNFWICTFIWTLADSDEYLILATVYLYFFLIPVSFLLTSALKFLICHRGWSGRGMNYCFHPKQYARHCKLVGLRARTSSSTSLTNKSISPSIEAGCPSNSCLTWWGKEMRCDDFRRSWFHNCCPMIGMLCKSAKRRTSLLTKTRAHRLHHLFRHAHHSAEPFLKRGPGFLR